MSYTLTDTGLVEELLQEHEEIQEQHRELRQLMEILSRGIVVETLSDEKIRIRGILLGEGIWKGKFWSAKEIEEMCRRASKRLKKEAIPLDVEHGQDERFLKNGERVIVGYLETLRFVPEIKACVHSSIITDKDAIKLVKNGELKGVSAEILADVVKINMSEGMPYILNNEKAQFMVKNLELLRVSLTKTPACGISYNLYVEALSRTNDKSEEDNIESVENMSKELEETKGTEATEVKEQEELAKKKKSKKEKKEEKEEYPYPYPYPYPEGVEDIWKKFEDLVGRLEKVVKKLEKMSTEALSEDKPEVKEEKKEKPKEEPPKEVKEEKPVEVKEVKEEPKPEPKEEPKKEAKPEPEPVKEEVKPKVEEPKKPSPEELEEILWKKVQEGEIKLGELLAKLSKKAK